VTEDRRVRVLLVDDQELMRRGLHTLLDLERDVRVVGEAADGDAALRLLDQVQVDVALVDARMPGMSGLQLIGRISRTHPHVACLVLTTFDDDEFLFGGLCAGARGFLLKDVAPEELVAAIRSAASGGTVVDGQVAGRLVARLSAPRAAAPETGEALSGREREIAELVATGASNREIAAALFLTEGTVKNHVSAALRKLGLRDRTQLALHIAQHR
jgi:DNA-binding NarL/FixJ family response regulator